MIKLRMLLAGLVCTVLMMTLGGCADRIEPGNLLVITAVGIAKGEKFRYHFYFEGINPSEFTETKRQNISNSFLFDNEADALSGAISAISQEIPLKPEFSHMQLIAIDDELLREGDYDYLDFADRFDQIRNNLTLIAVKDKAMKPIFSTTSPSLTIPSFRILMQLNELHEKVGGNYPTSLLQFINNLTQSGRNPILPVAQITNPSDKAESMDYAKQLDKQTKMDLHAIAVFREDKMVGELKDREARNVIVLQNQAKNTIYNYSCDAQKTISSALQYIAVNKKVMYRQNKPVLKVYMHATGTINSIQCANYFTGKSVEYTKINKELDRTIEKELTATIINMQTKYKSDIFGFGEKLRISDYKKFKEVKDRWNEEFARADVEVEVRVNVQRSGIRGEPFTNRIKNKKY
ncbi:germination protein, Ger(x)C family [Paenibacillus catalpae]|uniref:Germination protein, Ger(X)C family n=1 Tax=Paenibacillus catalpae TaxID=1045775 RepID=A0A1I1VDD4_9BACL|nr:Ger(x)C family spore germination protein [Paenibacillus catalpae]SFD81062.1 germination protein, Ger(x)C family [Paenibacillus catalpae]